MATKHELDLARRLIAARVLTQEVLRAAFALQAQLHAQGRTVGLERILQAKGWVPKGSLDALSARPPLEAQPFPDYRLEAMLGEGGSGIVYRGVYVPNGTTVAVKVLDPVQALREDFVARFRQEASILIELEHENIVLGYELGHVAGLHFFSMEYVEGLTLLEIIERRGYLTNREALSITVQAARALEFLHAAGYLHRDIKPGNIMVDGEGVARLIDLGLIRSLPKGGETGESAGDEETTTVGTVEYLSPEQARGRADLDPRSDIYSLGVTLYHMAVGDVPFHGETDYEVMAKQVLGALDTQKVKQRRIAPEVHFFITKMTSKERESRFETVDEVIRDIEGYLPEGRVPVDFGPPPAVAPVAAPVVAPVQAPARAPVAPRPRQLEPRPGPPMPGQAPAPRRSRRSGRTPRDGGGAAPRRKRR